MIFQTNNVLFFLWLWFLLKKLNMRLAFFHKIWFINYNGFESFYLLPLVKS